MSNEKMMILRMLEEGKINAADAAKLLATAENTSTPSPQQAPWNKGPEPTGHSAGQSSHGAHSSHSTHSSHSSHSPHSTGPIPNNKIPPRATTTPPTAPAAGSVIDDMGKKFGQFMKDMEPKIQRFAEVAVDKTSKAADGISKSLHDYKDKRHSPPPPPPPKKPSGTYYPQFPTTPTAPAHKTAHSHAGHAGIEEMIEISVKSAGSELNLSGLNGQVLIKGYNGDRISAKVFSVAKRPGAVVKLETLGNKYYLAYDEADFERVCIDAFVPETFFDNMRIATTNGDIKAAAVSTHFLQVENMNGATAVESINAANLHIESNNGSLYFADSTVAKANIENFNGAISISKVDVAALKAATFNGAIDMQIAAFAAYDHYNWHVETSNGKLALVLPSYSALGYHVKAHAALGDVKLGLVGMNYLRNDKSAIEAKSISYDGAAKKVDLSLFTSNASLVVN